MDNMIETQPPATVLPNFAFFHAVFPLIIVDVFLDSSIRERRGK